MENPKGSHGLQGRQPGYAENGDRLGGWEDSVCPCVSRPGVRGSNEQLGMRNRAVMYTGDTEVGGSHVVGKAGEPGSKIEIKCLGQNGVCTDGSLGRRVTGSLAEEGSSP